MGENDETTMEQPAEGATPTHGPDNGGSGPVNPGVGAVETDGHLHVTFPPDPVAVHLIGILNRYVLLEDGTEITPKTPVPELLKLVGDVIERYSQIADDHRDDALGMAQIREVLDGKFPTPCEKGIHPEVVRLLDLLLKPCPLCGKSNTPGIVHGTRCPVCHGHGKVWID